MSNMIEPTGLTALLGAPRAMILCRLDQPLTAGNLAERLLYSPSAITHHVMLLERSGLVLRERRGRHVFVCRTPLGSAIKFLYNDAD